MSFDAALQIADAVLYEGYILYPYRASAQKNQLRWQFGVLMPRAWSETGHTDPWASQTECLIEPDNDPTLRLRLRFLQAQAKTIEAASEPEGARFQPVENLEVDGNIHVTWDEGIPREIDASVDIDELLKGLREIPFSVPGERSVEPITDADDRVAGRTVRQSWELSGVLRLSAERLEGPYGVVRLQFRTENTTSWEQRTASRDEAIRASLVAAHTLIHLTGGAFISLLESPEWARWAVESCDNQHTWPVLIGDAKRRDLMLSSPIILYDYPTIAPESAGDLFDATEIDEILTLRTMTLTDAEKREARATDDRAAAIVDRVDAMPQEMLDKMHGAIRYLRDVTGPAEPEPERVPWWDPGADASVSPETDSVVVNGVAVARGSRVRLCPGLRRADAQDMFLAGRVATIEAVISDVDGQTHLAVTLTDDPAADLQQSHGRFLYFAPDEVEPLEHDG